MKQISLVFATLYMLASVLCAQQFDASKTDSVPTTLPVLKIILPDSISVIQHDRWMKVVSISLEEGQNGIVFYSDSVAIKGRGHSTWSKAKKPYVLEMYNNTPLLCMPSHHQWALLANVMDHSQMRNALAFEVARLTSLDWTSQGRFVRLEVNNEERGLYYLCELIHISPTRLHPDSCAVLLEFNNNKEDGIEVKLADGSHPNDWHSVVRPKSLRLDTLTLVDWLIVHELTMNAEPNGPRSCYMHITPDGRLKAGPIWDFDLAFNEVGISSDNNLRPSRFKGKMENVRWLTVDSIYCLTSPYLLLLREHGFPIPSKEELQPLIMQRWKQLRPQFVSLTAYIDSIDAKIRKAAINDQVRWNAADPARFDPCGSYGESIERLQFLYRKRIEVMDKILSIVNK